MVGMGSTSAKELLVLVVAKELLVPVVAKELLVLASMAVKVSDQPALRSETR